MGIPILVRQHLYIETDPWSLFFRDTNYSIIFAAKYMTTQFFNSHILVIFHHNCPSSLLWRHNGRDGVSNHQPHYCLCHRLFRRLYKKKTSKLPVTGPCIKRHQSSPSLALVREIHRWPVNSPHKWPVTRNMFPLDDVIMCHDYVIDNKSTKGRRTEVNMEMMKCISYCVDKLRDDAWTDGHTDRQTQPTKIHEGHNWPRVKKIIHAIMN